MILRYQPDPKVKWHFRRSAVCPNVSLPMQLVEPLVPPDKVDGKKNGLIQFLSCVVDILVSKVVSSKW